MNEYLGEVVDLVKSTHTAAIHWERSEKLVRRNNLPIWSWVQIACVRIISDKTAADSHT